MEPLVNSRGDSFCTRTLWYCSHCSSTVHNHESCDSNHKKCINCEKYNSRLKNPNSKPLNTNHDCLNKSCPTYEFEKNKIFEKIDYGL